MDELFQPDSNFPFDDIKLKTPRALQGGTYTANLSLNDNSIIIQTPKCKTKKGITKTAKQLYSDLLFNQDHNEFVEWLETFQERVRELIYENSENWFHESPTLDDIEYNWNNAIRVYKQTNYLVRTFIHKTKNVKSISLQIYDSDQKELKIEDVDKEKNVICILEIVGIKFSSQSFQLDICLRQIMVLNEKPIFNKCLIKLEKSKQKQLDLGENQIENVDTEKNKEKVTDYLSETNNNLEFSGEKNNSKIESEENKDRVNADGVNADGVAEQEDDNILEKINKEENLEENNVKDNEKENIILKKEVKKELEKENKKQNEKDLEKIDGLEEIELNVDDVDEIKLKKPNEVYLDIYREARNKAKLAKKAAITAYLEAKKIKELYMLDAIDSSSSESDEDLDEDDELFSES